MFGVVKGVAAATPVAPSVPSGGLALAQVLLPAGVSNTAASGVVITQTYIGAALKGDMLQVQTSAQRDALPKVPDGTVVHNVGDGCDYVRKRVSGVDGTCLGATFIPARIRYTCGLLAAWDTSTC